MQTVRLLVVDDSPAIRDGVRSILRAYPDIEVVGEAKDGLEAVAEAERLVPDVVLMDAQMPGMDGVEATRRIKERPSHIRVLFYTVHIGFIEDALAAGADAYLLKDSGRQELVQVIMDQGQPGTTS